MEDFCRAHAGDQHAFVLLVIFACGEIHDGKIHEKAKFDHSLFCQVTGDAPLKWEESPELADAFVKVKQTDGIVDPNAHVYRKLMKGSFDNKDVLV